MNRQKEKSAEKVRVIAFVVVVSFILAGFLVYLINASGVNFDITKTAILGGSGSKSNSSDIKPAKINANKLSEIMNRQDGAVTQMNRDQLSQVMGE